MQSTHIIRSVNVERTPRVLQLEGMFDLSVDKKSIVEWDVALDLPDNWNIGLIVGPSGAGKTTVASELFTTDIVDGWEWPAEKSVVDGFPIDISIKDVVQLMSSVGFSSPPSWLRPYHVLSNGEKFRADMARTLAEKTELAVVDEFTSVIDRNVAQIGSAAIAKTVRRRDQKFIAVGCHYDVIDWLDPDWIYEPHINKFTRRSLRRRPVINLTIKRVHHSAWELFRKYHYLDSGINKSAICFVAFWREEPVAFTAILHHPTNHVRNMKREHRTVCLPDFQGAGIGNAVSNYIGQLFKSAGFKYISITGHPALIRSRAKSKIWKMKKKPTIKGATVGPDMTVKAKFSSRLRATFEYVGPRMEKQKALQIIHAGTRIE